MLLLGRYELIQPIGRGGMAEVWEAHVRGDRGFSRRVAVKRLAVRGAEMEGMFADEARIASRLHHPNVVAVLDFGVSEGVLFQVLEYVDGLDASALQRLASERGAPFPVGCALHVVAEVARGLEHAHGARGDDGALLGIVHRDVSPHNVLVAWTGEVKLGDFGIAFARDRVEETQAGVTKGKPSYMAPEQVTRGTLDGRTDLFALGCVLHALVAGVSPLAGEDRMADLLAGKPLPLAPELPDDVRAIVARATQRSRSERYQDAAAFAMACDEAARARAERDPKRSFIEWLGTLRPTPAPPAGALDALFGTWPSPDGSLSLSLPPDQRASQPQPQPEPQPHRQPQPQSQPPQAQARRAWPRVALAAGALAALSGVALAMMGRPAAEPPLEPVAFEIPAPAAAALDEAPAIPPAPAAAAPPAHASTSPAPKPPRAQAPAGTGVLQIGGEVALRKEIVIDGKSVGFAPKTLEVPAGMRQVVLRDADGTVIVSRRIEITSWNTRSAPARWMPGAEEDEAPQR